MGIERITKRIVLDDQFLDKNINRHLFNKLKDIAENDCSKEYGYIIEVKKIIEILDNYISNVNSELIFIVLFEAETIKPEVNSVYEDEVYLALRGGIFFEVSKKFKVLIPPVSLTRRSISRGLRSWERVQGVA
jgi:DNA-directed RNA polymerase subunit E'/Rpb7